MKILVLGYIPKEIGGTYTTGIANVVLEFCKCKHGGIDLLCFASNAAQSKAQRNCLFQTWGYTKNLFYYIWYILKHPMKTITSLKYYHDVLYVNPFRYLFYHVNIYRCIRSFQPNIIHAMTCGLLPVAKQIVGDTIPCVVTFHGFHYHKAVNTLKDDLFLEGVMPICDEVTILTQETKDDIQKYFPSKYKHLAIIPNGCDSRKFYFSNEERSRIRQKYGISNEEPVFVTVGNVNENKGQLRFIKYLHESKFEKFKYLIIGGGVDIKNIKDYIEKNGLEDKVLLIGYVPNDEAYKYYSAADFYALTSQSEGQSLSELEAESTGLRVLINESLTGTIPGDITDKEKYYILNFEQTDNDSFYDWINSPSKERESTDIYDWNKVFLKYVSLYKDILSNDETVRY